MKNEKKRYFLVEFIRSEKRICKSKEEYEILLNKINNYNLSKGNNYIVGNIFQTLEENDTYFIDFNVYKKLSSKMTLTDLDNYTKEYYNQEDLVENIKDKLNNKEKPVIKVAYLQNISRRYKTIFDADRRIGLIEVLYKKDLDYLRTSSIINGINEIIRNNDYNFFYGLIERYESNKSLCKILDKIGELLDNSKYNNIKLEDTNLIYLCEEFYVCLISEKDKDGFVLKDEYGKSITSRRRKRDFAFLIKKYLCKDKELKAENDYMSQRLEKEMDLIEEEKHLDSWDGIGMEAYIEKKLTLSN